MLEAQPIALIVGVACSLGALPLAFLGGFAATLPAAGLAGTGPRHVLLGLAAVTLLAVPGLVVTGRWYPSSKTCSGCGHLLAELKLGTRHWTCPSCGTRHDRDLNAAKNILAAGRAVARGSPGGACGAGIRHLETPPVRPAVKQEPRLVTAGILVLQGGE